MIEILQGDCRDVLKTLPDESVQCVVTSPPYWGLRDYGVDNQIGLEKTPQEYVATMVQVFRELKRVLKSDGTVFLNLGDSYFGGGRGGNPSDSKHRKQSTNAGSLIKTMDWKAANARHEASCDTSGKALEDSQASGCLCGNLCGVCRVAYRSTTHNDPQHASMLRASLHATNRESMVSPIDHLPTLDSSPMEVRTQASTQRTSEISTPYGVRLRALLESMLGESFPQLLDVCLRRDASLECLLCARSLEHGDFVSCDKKAFPCEPPIDGRAQTDHSLHISCSEEIDGALDASREGMVFDSCSYQHSAITSHHGQLKPKDLVGIPWRVAFALQEDGWWLRSDIIWSKPNPMPESVTDRPTKAHEYIFLLTKSPKYFYDAAAIAEPASYAMHAQMEQGYEGEGQKDYEANGVQNPSDVKRRIIENAKRKSWKGSEFHTGKTAIHQQGRASVKRGDFNGKTNELEGREAFRAFTITRNKRTVWTVPSSPYRDAHFATFPPALISPCILAGTKPGDTVLDPFGGSGTTGQVALGCGRKAILIELNPEYHKMIEKRTQVLGFQF